MAHTNTDFISLLLQAPVFQGCERYALESLLSASHHRIRKKEADSVVAYKGDECNEVMVLLEGTVYSTMTGEEKEVVVEQLIGPVVLAPAFVFAKENRMPVNVICKTSCTMLYIDRQVFLEMLHRDSTLMANFIQVISNRCQRLSQRLNDFAVQSLKERVLEYLRQHQRIDNVGWLSRVLGVARPSLSRVLSELKAEGLIERTLDGIELRQTC